MIYLVVFCLELVNLLIFNSCFVNTDMSKLQGGSSGGDKYGYSSLSSSLFGFFLPLLDWNFGFFIGFAGAFVVWVCCGFCLIIFVWDFVAGCTECLGVFVQLFFG